MIMIAIIFVIILPSISGNIGNNEIQPQKPAETFKILGTYLAMISYHQPYGQKGVYRTLSKQSNISRVNSFSKFILDDYQLFSMEIGFNRGQTSLARSHDNMFTIAVDANHALVKNFYENNQFDSIRSSILMIPGAVASKTGVAQFNTGFGWNNVSDTGSLFGWTDPLRESERKQYIQHHLVVPLFRLDALLQYVPPPRPPDFVWDTFKVDVQGADADAILGVGEYLSRFMCVVGEFDTLGYNMTGVYTDAHSLLLQASYLQVYAGVNEIWLNTHRVDEYRKQPERYHCHSVYDSRVVPATLIANYEKGGVSR